MRIVVVAATLVVATLGDVLLARCSGSCLRVNIHPTHLVGELAAELGGYGATQSAPSVGSIQHLGGCHDRRMSLRVFSVLHAQLNVGLDGQEVVAKLTAEAFQHVALHGLHELGHASLGDRWFYTLAVHCLVQQLVKRERAVGDGYGIEGMGWISSDLFSPCQS